MSTDAAESHRGLTPLEQLNCAREIIRAEGSALLTLSDELQADFCQAVDLVLECQGNVIVTGMGKAGLIGRKISATLGSTGTSSHFVHPSEAIHGDLGRLHPNDIVLALSFSGETEETVQLIPSFNAMGIPLIAMTGSSKSRLALAAQVTLRLGPLHEACSLGLAPSTSTTAMLALGDALALVVSQTKQFDRDSFARFHPGGSLGRKLAKVEDVMRPLAVCRIAQQVDSVRQVLVRASRPGRRTGAIMLVNLRGKLTGLFTDSDLARILEGNDTDETIDGPIEGVMTRQPATVLVGTRLVEAVELLAARKISELPVVDHRGVPAGLIDITDVVSLSLDTSEHETVSTNQDTERPMTVRFPSS